MDDRIKERTKSALMERVKRLREEKLNITRAQLAEDIGASASAIGNYENGKRTPEPDVIVKLATRFGVSLEYLLGLTDVEDYSLEMMRQETGISIKTINRLMEMSDVAHIVDFIIQHKNFDTFAQLLEVYGRDKLLESAVEKAALVRDAVIGAKLGLSPELCGNVNTMAENVISGVMRERVNILSSIMDTVQQMIIDYGKFVEPPFPGGDVRQVFDKNGVLTMGEFVGQIALLDRILHDINGDLVDDEVNDVADDMEGGGKEHADD